MKFITHVTATAVAACCTIGCQSDSTPVQKTEGMMGRAELDARGDALIEQGTNRRLVGMSYGSNMQRRGGPDRMEIIRDGEVMIDHGRRLKAMAATRPS